MLADKLPKTAVIGANGFLGSAFFYAYRAKHPGSAGTSEFANTGGLIYLDLLSPDISKLGLRATGHKDALILAAIPGVDRCEQEKDLTRRVNVEGTLKLAEQLVSEGIKPVFFSSDYVFDGITGGYSDDAPVNPITEYGRQKAAVEEGLKRIAPNGYLVVRMSKVFSLKKGDKTLLDEMGGVLSGGGTLRAAYDQIFCPTLVTDVINAVSQLQAKGLTGIVNVCAEEAWSRYDLAKAVAGAMSIDPDRIAKVSLDEIGFKAKRPKNTSLVPKRLLFEVGSSFTPISECMGIVAENWRKK